MKKIISAIALGSILFFQVQAKASTTVDFEDLYGQINYVDDIPPSYVGLTWSGIYAFTSDFTTPAYDTIGSVSAFTRNNGGGFSASEGSLFTVQSLAMLPTFHDYDTVNVIGYLGDQSVYENVFSITKSYDTNGDLIYSTFTLNTGSVDTILFRSTYWANQIILDNIIFNSTPSSPVPIPSAIWLLGSGLMGIVGVRRKFKK